VAYLTIRVASHPSVTRVVVTIEDTTYRRPASGLSTTVSAVHRAIDVAFLRERTSLSVQRRPYLVATQSTPTDIDTTYRRPASRRSCCRSTSGTQC